MTDDINIIRRTLEALRERGHVDDGYCLCCDSEPDAALDSLEARLQGDSVLQTLDHLRERTEQAERERDEARRNADGMARAPYGEFESMRRERDEARAEADRLREALQQIGEGEVPNLTFPNRLAQHLRYEAFARVALTAPQTKEQT